MSFQAGGEKPLAQRVGQPALRAGQVLLEELEVAAVVEDVEAALVLAGSEEVRPQPGPPTDHLPELGLGVDRLEEDEVDHVGDVDAGVKHVHGNGDVGRLLRVAEIVDQVLSVGHAMVDAPSDRSLVVRVVDIEPFNNEVRVRPQASDRPPARRRRCLSGGRPRCHSLLRKRSVDGVFSKMIDNGGNGQGTIGVMSPRTSLVRTPTSRWLRLARSPPR